MTPLSSRWLKEQVQMQKTVPAIASTRWKQYRIPSELKTKKKRIGVSLKFVYFKNNIAFFFKFRFANVLAQAASLVGSPLADEGFLYHSETTKNENGDRTYGELNTGQWWERTEKDNQFPSVDN
jgi:hypothetical protein